MEKAPCYTTSGNSTDYFNRFQDTFQVVAPINIVLSVLIFFWNSLVISYFYKNCQKVTSALFFLIGVSDVTTAMGHLVFDMAALIYLIRGESGTSDSTMTVCYVLYRFVALIGYTSAIFLNAMLAVIRTIKIVYPFRLTNMVAVKVFGAMWGMFLLAVTLWDCVFAAIYGWERILEMKFREIDDAFIIAIDYPGQTIAWFRPTFAWRKAVEVLFLSIFYFIPVLVVFGSMVVQVLKTTRVCRSGDDDEDTPLITDMNHVNTTVCLLAVVFLICNGATSFYAICVSGKSLISSDYIFLALFSSTLPLFNALVTPLIIVTRSTNLRIHILRRLRTVCCFSG